MTRPLHSAHIQPRPSHREPWFWLVMFPLFLVLVVCSVLVSFAFLGADDRVMDDYYKQGRMINHRFAAEELAAELNVGGRLWFGDGEVVLNLTGRADPEVVTLSFSHPADAERDNEMVLRKTGTREYRAVTEREFRHRWYIILTAPVEPAQQWRISAEMDFERSASVHFSAAFDADNAAASSHPQAL